MIALNSPELSDLSQLLRKYKLQPTLTLVSGLLTEPTLQANTLRLETLVHLIVAHCRGDREPRADEIGHWLNKQLGTTHIAALEDPVEDVFVTNVETPEGNRRTFEGIWKSNDYFVQVVLKTLGGSRVPQKCRDLLVPAYALLKLSDCLAERVKLHRWHREPSNPNNEISLAPITELVNRSRAVTFTDIELDVLGINRRALAPFFLKDKDKQWLADETIGHSSLERQPLLIFGSQLVLTLPHSVSPAIRRFVLFELQRMGYLQAFAQAFDSQQARQVEKSLRELKKEAVSLQPPRPDGKVPTIHTWLLKHNVDKYLHVVLLSDSLDLLEAQGLSSVMAYPEEVRADLETYLCKVATHCQSLPGFADGVTLLVLGGLGRGVAFGFKDCPDRWRLSGIRISDLLMLAGEPGRPITRYLKCIKQKEWAEEKGVIFHNLNGDYNLYCFWRHRHYLLVPDNLPVAAGTTLYIPNDMVLPVREEVRKIVDHHVIQTTAGSYVPVVRFGQDAYFKSMKDRPIYASLGHLNAGVLAGVVETPRGPSWLVVKPMNSNELMRRLVYEMWSGFISLYERLVFEVEDSCSNSTPDAMEICLNLGEVTVSEKHLEAQPDLVIGEPEIAVNLNQQTAEVKFPSNFLIYFQRPENIGERLVLRSIAHGLVCLHQGVTKVVDESILDNLMSRVIGAPGMRVIHAFHTYHPIEHLLAQQGNNPTFLADEDFVFAKLKLSEGCTGALTGTIITSKSECNRFLNNVVEKVWNQIRILLRQLDRTSVIRGLLKLNEDIIQDRDNWRRTAQAVLALYQSEEDVFTVAQERESARANVSLTVRTILEMAICECTEIDGSQLSRWSQDELLAKAALLIEVATDSDAIRSNLIKPRIHLYLNGDYNVDRSFHDTVIRPFLKNYMREEYEGAARKYDQLYQVKRPGERVLASEVFPSDLIPAFHAEFGLTLDDAIDGIAELLDLAVECKSVVVEATLGDLIARLNKYRGLSPDVGREFFDTFSIFHRPAWEKPPPLFSERDLYPWRFRRRLSLASRPILAYGKEDDAKVIFGAGTLQLGFRNLLDKSSRGRLPQEFFTSPEMKKFIGAINDQLGHTFTRSVADKLREAGWLVRKEVPMTELGGPPALGDIDVLSWKPNGTIYIIECKRLQLARTVAEIGEICRRFSGEAKDELDRHIQRVNWLKTNPETLKHIVGFLPVSTQLHDRLVTNTHVPMMYLTSLPIEARKIGPLALGLEYKI